MKPKLATSCFVIAALLISPVAARAADAAPARPLTFVKDSAITARIKARLAEEKTANLAHVKVDADHNGTVLLSGKVDTRSAEEKAVSIARETEGVKLVRSNIQVLNEE